MAAKPARKGSKTGQKTKTTPKSVTKTVVQASVASSSVAPVVEKRAAPRPDVMAAERLAAQVEDVVVVRNDAMTSGRAERGHEWRRLDSGLVDKTKTWLWDRGVGRALGKSDVAAVKEGVMAELRQIRQDNLQGVTTSPFGAMLLPERVKPRRKDAWKWFGGVCLALIFVLLWLGGRTPDSPDRIVMDALAAAKSGKADRVAQLVDLNALSADVVDQVMAAPVVEVEALPEGLQGHLQRDLKARMEAMIKPGLADKMAEQMGALTTEKRWPVPQDGLLYQVWEDLGGEGIAVGRPVVVGQSDHAAIVALPVNGADVTGVLEVALARNAESRWQVVGVPNLSQVLLARDAERATQVEIVGAGVAALEQAGTTPVTAASATRTVGRDLDSPADVVEVKDVTKGKQGNDALVIRAVVVNKSGVAVQHVNWAVLFADAANVPMLEIPLELAEPLPAGGTREQVWTVPLDQSNPKARYVRDLPQSALKVTARVVRVVGP